MADQQIIGRKFSALRLRWSLVFYGTQHGLKQQLSSGTAASRSLALLPVAKCSGSAFS
jgi:hypothetical protein